MKIQIVQATAGDNEGGTDADVWISFEGTNGDFPGGFIEGSGFRVGVLLDIERHNDRERGDIDRYVVNTGGRDLGTIQKVFIRFEPAGEAAAWKIAWQTIKVDQGPTQFLVPKDLDNPFGFIMEDRIAQYTFVLGSPAPEPAQPEFPIFPIHH